MNLSHAVFVLPLGFVNSHRVSQPSSAEAMLRRPVATPAGIFGGLICSGGLDWSQGEELLSKLPANLQREAAVDLQRLWQPVYTEWLQKWDADDDELEPEEPLSDDEVEADESPEKRARLGGAAEAPAPDDGYPQELWPAEPRQGQVGFNAVAKAFLDRCSWTSPAAGEVQLLKQQHVVARIFHPKSPVQRLLADHNTGSGKTLIMIRALDNYYLDPRAKIAVFPKDVVVDNFYLAIIEWPSRWRDYVCVRKPELACIASGSSDWKSVQHERWDINLLNPKIRGLNETTRQPLNKVLKEFCVKPTRETLEMKRAFFNGRRRKSFLASYGDESPPPAAPLRAYRFTSAGGRAAEIDENTGLPRGCIFKIGFDPETADCNPYSGKVVVMDEAHHLTRPHRLFKSQLENLRGYLGSAKNLSLLAVTGSMVEDSVKDPKALLDAVKGVAAPTCDEGYLSTHNVRGAAFPRQVPTRCADGELNEVVEEDLVQDVELTGASLVRYMYKAIQEKREGAGDAHSNLPNFTNVYVYFGSVKMPACKRAIAIHTGTHAPKFEAVVTQVVEWHRRQEKCVIHIRNRTGGKALFALLEEAGDRHDFSVADLNLRADFNAKTNSHGQHYICMMADADAGSESIEFKCVRHHVLVDVPERHADYIQRCGRTVRTNSHFDVSDSEREVRFKLMRAVLPDYAQSELGAFVLWALCGYWGGPKKVNVNSEPEPAAIEDAAQELLAAFGERGVTSVVVLLRHATVVEDVVSDLQLEAKLKKRMAAALAAIRHNPAQLRVAQSLERDTIDERRMRSLQRQAARLAPAAAKVRYHALDAGMY